MRTYGGISAEERVAARRERLLDAGLELFGTRGFDAVGVKEVCRAAGVTDRYFYESFRDREALFRAVFDRLTEELFTSVAEAVVAVEPKPEPQMRAAIGTFIRMLADDPRKPRIVFADTGGDHMKQTLRRFQALVAATARQHGVRDPSMLAIALVGTLERVVVEWQDGQLDLSVDDIVDQTAELFLGLF
jgi:AcrR family transcriptional regulator